MNRFDDTGADRGQPTDPAVRWITYEDEDLVHAVADVPQHIPKADLGFAATESDVTVFVGSPTGPRWTVDLPVAVNPTPVSVAYNNGVFQVAFTVATADPLDAFADSTVDAA